jgi:hypothetical protein
MLLRPFLRSRDQLLIRELILLLSGHMQSCQLIKRLRGIKRDLSSIHQQPTHHDRLQLLDPAH